MPREYPRKLRVASQLRRVLNELLLSDAKDPRLVGVRISDVQVSSDMSVAKVFFSTLHPDADPEPPAAVLAKAGGYLRSCAGKALRLRRVPELRFFHDGTGRQGFEVTRLIEASSRAGRREPSE